MKPRDADDPYAGTLGAVRDMGGRMYSGPALEERDDDDDDRKLRKTVKRRRMIKRGRAMR